MKKFIRNRFSATFPLLFVLGLPSLLPAADPLYLELSAHGQRLDLGLADFSTSRQKVEEASVARQIRDVVRSDLLFPRVFNLVEGGVPPVRQRVSMDSWKELGADVLVTGTVDAGWFGRTEFSGTLYDVSSGETILHKRYMMEPGQERRIAHEWADEIVRYFLGEAGIAHTKITFVNDATGKKEVCVVDYDGQNFRRLTGDRSIALFPKFSPDGKSIVYATYLEGSPMLYVIGSDGRSKRPLCRYPGLNSAAAWLPDGQNLVATLSLGRNPNLHLVDLEGKILRTLTNFASADTAPTLSPDGLHLAFTSDRPGYPQIYTMDTNGANLKRLTDSGQCDSPAWSPQGHLVAFTMSVSGGLFDIFTVEVGTGRQRRLTFGEGDNENAAWSPDGRYLVFTSTRRGRPELWVMGYDGSNPQPVGNFPGRSFTPHWGP
ncbi:MAG: PD40 domain-containing protein [Elusimicrobia bacterium]|nr:PD40 domain-containing protein [Elusimicrobiota bacterium]